MNPANRPPTSLGKFQLARPGLVPPEFSAYRIDAARSLYYGDEFKVELPTGSGQQKTLWNAPPIYRGAFRIFFCAVMVAVR